jgi:prefoldin subunit 5
MERIAALQAEAHDLREQNELLEFRILELEECQENVSNIISSEELLQIIN